MLKKIIQFSIIILILIHLNCEKEFIEPQGPDLKGKVKIEIKLVNECPDNQFIKPLIKDGVKIYNTCKEPLFSIKDYRSIKLLKKNNNNSVIYYFGIIFNNAEILKAATKIRGRKWSYYVNDSLKGVIVLFVRIECGFIFFGDFSEKEIIELIGAETFKQYQTVWKNSSDK